MRLIDADKADVERIYCFYGSECRTEDVQEWLDDQPTVNPYEWISVEDRLPEESGSYLVCCQLGNTRFVWIYDFAVNLSSIDSDLEDKNYSGWWECDDCDGVQYFNEVTHITHWMPLPALPTEKEN